MKPDLDKDIIFLIKNNHSNAYIESAMYAKWNHSYNIRHISNTIKKLRTAVNIK